MNRKGRVKEMKTNRSKTVLTVCIVLALLAGGGYLWKTKSSCGSCGMASESERKDDKKEDAMALSSFTLKDVNGEEVKSSDLKGKKVYLKFWASWCPHCLESLPDTEALSKEDNDFEVITVVSPEHSNEKNAADFKSWYAGLDYKQTKVLLDEKGEALTKKLGIRAYPTSVFIGTDGKVAKTQSGNVSKEDVKKIMSEIK